MYRELPSVSAERGVSAKRARTTDLVASYKSRRLAAARCLPTRHPRGGIRAEAARATIDPPEVLTADEEFLSRNRRVLSKRIAPPNLEAWALQAQFV